MGGKSSQAFLGCEKDESDGQVRPVVMVFLPEDVVADDVLLAKVVAETRVASQIDHINVIGVWGVARLEEGTARVVEFADAESLYTLYQRLDELGETLPLPVAAAIAQNACMGVHYAHELGRMEMGEPLLHGGIRPQTLLVSFQGMAKVTGYGAATLAGWLRRSRGEEAAVRDPYTAPEQIFGGRTAATVQTDVYALGALMYEAFLRKAPIGDDAGLADALIRDDIDMSHFADSGVPDALAEVIVRAMRRKSDERFSSALDMRHAILDTGLCATEPQVRSFLEETFPIDYPTRVARMNLLATARHKRRTEPSMRAVSGSNLVAPASTNAKDTVVPGHTPVPDSLLAPPDGTDETNPLAPPREGRADHEASTAPVAAVTTPPRPVAAPPAAYAAAPTERVVVVKNNNAMLILLALIAGAAITAVIALLLREPAPPPVVAAPPASVPVVPPPPPPSTPEPTGPTRTTATGSKKSTTSGRTVKPTPKKPATLSISTISGVSILIDGKKVGTGSGKAEVRPGKRKVALIDKKRGINIYRSVRVGSGENKRMEFDIGKGELVLDAPAGATVLLDGRKVGTTPIAPFDVYEGSHNVVLKKDGATFRKAFKVRPGDQVSVWAEFRQR